MEGQGLDERDRLIEAELRVQCLQNLLALGEDGITWQRNQQCGTSAVRLASSNRLASWLSRERCWASSRRSPRVAFPHLPALPPVPDLVNPDAWLSQVKGQHLVRRVNRKPICEG